MTEIRPGDSVLLPVVMGMTDAEISELRTELVDAFPGVRWCIQRDTMTTSALVYRAPASDRERSNLAAQEIPRLRVDAQRMRRKLCMALDLLDKVIEAFVAGEAVESAQIERWQGWVNATRETIKEAEGDG